MAKMNFTYIRKIGSFQWMCILSFATCCGINIQTSLSILFIVPKVDFHCTDASEAFQNLTWTQQKTLMTASGRCNRPDLNLTQYSADELKNLNLTSSSPSRPCDTGFVWDRKDFDYTGTEQYGLVCGRKWMVSMSKTAYMLGYFIGAVASGVVSDRFGRKIACTTFAALTAGFNIVSAYAPTAEVFLLARCLVGASGIAFYTAGLVLCTELVRKDERKVPRTMLSLFINLSLTVLVGLSALLRDHRFLQTCISCVMAVFTVIMWFVLPESPKWLTAKERNEEANEVVERIAKFNKCSPNDLLHLLVKDKKSDQLERDANLTDLFRTPVLRKRTLTVCVMWFGHVMTFYTILYNLGSFYPNLRISLLISQCIELPFLMVPLFTIDIVGRQVLSFIFLSTAGVMCLVMSAFVGGNGSIVLLVLAVVGKMATISQFYVSYIYTQELMPTVLRSQGLGLASTVSRIGGMLAPQLVLLDDFWPASSVVIIGTAALISGIIALVLPDTTGHELPQSIMDGEHFKARHVYGFNFARRRKPVEGDDADNTESASFVADNETRQV